MNRKQLIFPNSANAWDFITAAKISNVDVEEATVSGFFTDSDVELARDSYGAKVQDAPTPAPAPVGAGHRQPPPADPPPEQEVELVGKSGKTYIGNIYTTDDYPADLPRYGIICLSLGVPLNGGWQYAIRDVFYTAEVSEELERFRGRADLTHFIVIPVKKGDVKGVDDLIRNYLHQ